MTKIFERFGLFAVSAFVAFMMFAAISCVTVRTDFSGVTKDTWYSSSDVDVALKFDETGQNTSGKYILTNRAVSKISNFQVKNRWGKLVFVLDKNRQLSIKGHVSMDGQNIVITKKDGATIIFKPQETPVIPAKPFRYSDEIFSTIETKTYVYGKAPGFYSSKHVDGMSSDNYAKIILGIAGDVTQNLFTDSVALAMDVYYPKGDTVKSRPLLMIIHGGAFVAGDKKDDFPANLAKHYAKCGYVVASINYRMGYVFLPGLYSNLERCMYRGLQDVRAALRYLSENKKKFGIDPKKVFVAGNSAGGFLTLLTAYMKNSEAWSSTEDNIFLLQKDLGCLDCSSNNAKGTYTLAGIISMWGGIDDINWIEKDEKVPTLLIHGDADLIVPYNYNYPFANINATLSSFFTNKVYGSKPVYDKLKKLGIPAKLKTIKGAGHEPQSKDNGSFNNIYDTIKDGIRTFNYDILQGEKLVVNGPETVSKTDEVAKYSIAGSGYSKVIWDCSGGIIVDHKDNWAQVVWFESEQKGTIKCAATNYMALIKTAEKSVSQE